VPGRAGCFECVRACVCRAALCLGFFLSAPRAPHRGRGKEVPPWFRGWLCGVSAVRPRSSRRCLRACRRSVRKVFCVVSLCKNAGPSQNALIMNGGVEVEGLSFTGARARSSSQVPGPRTGRIARSCLLAPSRSHILARQLSRTTPGRVAEGEMESRGSHSQVVKRARSLPFASTPDRASSPRPHPRPPA